MVTSATSPPANISGASAAQATKPPAVHIAALDGVRGVAILIVLAGHLFGANAVAHNRWFQAVYSIRGLSWTAVNLFFALSGFLITSILVNTLDSPTYFRTFFWRRSLRIFPLYYGVLLILLAITPIFHPQWEGSAWRFLTYTQNLPFSIHPKGPWGVLFHFWSLAVEEQFYLLWAVVVFWMRSPRRIFIAAISGSVIALLLRTAVALTGNFPENHSTPFCMDGLLLGSVLALAVRSPFRDTILRYGRFLTLAAVLCIVPIAVTRTDFYWETSTYLTTIGITIINLGAVGLIADALRPGSTTERILRVPVLRFFGKYSYGLYVFHVILGTAVGHFTAHLVARLAASGYPSAMLNIAPGLLTLALSIALSIASFHLYEAPFLRLKNSFRYAPAGSR